jgi:hypothetical protein
MRLAILGVVIAYLVVGSVEAYIHWYAGTQDTPKAHSLREWYLYRDPINDKPNHAGFADLIFPAIALGLAAGALTARQSLHLLVWCLFLLPLGVVALFPLYAAFIPTKESDEWWKFATCGVRAVAFIPGYFKAALMCLFFGAVGRNGVRQIQGRKLDAV